MPNVHEYEFSFKVVGYYTAHIEAPNKEIAADIACEMVNEADFGELCNIDIDFNC